MGAALPALCWIMKKRRAVERLVVGRIRSEPERRDGPRAGAVAGAARTG
ncbi:hypothetical protein [Tsukamurella paurometabola]|nr:hypothetical protein [Tsukamurella paurometabola]UEA84328.1 hypothetical protein LK411_05740 [Tsukamurella paurometabola]